MESSWLLKRENGLAFVLVLVLVLAVTAESLPSTENICNRVENYTVTVKEQYQQPVLITTTSWCFSIPPKCTRDRIEMRTQFRIKSEVKQRNITDCCEGYIKQKYKIDNYYIEKCIPMSNCSAGFIGNKCDIECPEGTWGISCQQTCSCGPKGLCSGINGTCICLPGWRGSNCTEKCQLGKWGHNCSISCSCINGFCHHETGQCTLTNITLQIHQLLVTEKNSGITSVTSTDTIYSPTTEINSPADNIYNNDNYSSSTELELASSTISNEMTSKLETPAINPVITETNEVTPTTSSNALATTTGSGVVRKIDTSTSISTSTSTSTSRPILAVLHVSGKSNPNQMITSSIGTGLQDPLGADKIPVHVPISLDIIAFIVIGSILSLGLTIMAVLAILHVRAKLYETIRLSIYDTEKFPEDHNTNIKRSIRPRTQTLFCEPRSKPTLSLTREKGADRHTISRNSHILTPVRDYETPRCIIPERPGTLPRPTSITRESTYSNQYPNIHLFNDLRELLEAHYDRPPANSFRQLVLPTNNEGEHLYDEIPLQTTTFSSKSDSSKEI